VQTGRPRESFEGSYSSRVIASYSSHQWETHAFSDFGGKWGFWAMTLVPNMLEGQARALSTREIIQFQKKFETKFWLIGLASRALQSWSKKRKHPHFASPCQANPSPKSKKCFLIEPRRLAASVEGLNNSVAIAAGEL